MGLVATAVGAASQSPAGGCVGIAFSPWVHRVRSVGSSPELKALTDLPRGQSLRERQGAVAQGIDHVGVIGVWIGYGHTWFELQRPQ